jgi:hypothetical protein
MQASDMSVAQGRRSAIGGRLGAVGGRSDLGSIPVINDAALLYRVALGV